MYLFVRTRILDDLKIFWPQIFFDTRNRGAKQKNAA